ncbi:MAG: hypothetical protein M3Y59_22465 [Myxococcota bacterium]|nr:hypothetical protein [Myxococcota bacterium]
MVLVVATQTAPPPPAPGPNPHLARAIRQVEDLEEQAALESLELARRWPEVSTSQLAQVHLYEGLAHAGLANGPEAISSFHAARLLDPAVALPSGSSPRVREWWVQATPASRVTQAPGPKPELQGPPPAATAPPPVLESSSPAIPRWVPYAVAAVAVLSVGTAVWSGSQASLHAREANDLVDIGPASALRAQAVGEAFRANLLYGGAVLLGGGAAILFVVPF